MEDEQNTQKMETENERLCWEVDPNYEEKMKKKMALLDTLPKLNTNAERQIGEFILRYLDLAKKGRTVNTSFKEKRELANPEFLQTSMKSTDVEEYGTNYPKEVMDPKKIAEGPDDYYDGILRKQTNMQFSQPKPQQAETNRKSLWDAQNESTSTNTRFGQVAAASLYGLQMQQNKQF